MLETVNSPRANEPLLGFRGVHHLALTTDDMKATVAFYTEVLGMPIVHAMKVPPGLGTGPLNRGNPPFENIRHYLFDMGNDSILAFFEIPKGAKKRADRNDVAGLQHLAMAASAEAAAQIMERLHAHGVACNGPVESIPGLQSLYFEDPNGIRLELAWRPVDVDGRVAVIESVAQSEESMRRELSTLGRD
jgi:catechol 2,3-dioxygenase-like lactoylglutathione lyase family enzyme